MKTRIDTKQIQELRGSTGAGVMDCKSALEEASGDFAKARAILEVESYIDGEGGSHLGE